MGDGANTTTVGSVLFEDGHTIDSLAAHESSSAARPRPTAPQGAHRPDEAARGAHHIEGGGTFFPAAAGGGADCDDGDDERKHSKNSRRGA
jgi:hypothetical protein